VLENVLVGRNELSQIGLGQMLILFGQNRNNDLPDVIEGLGIVIGAVSIVLVIDIKVQVPA
jgi:hypothetical protein